MITEEQLIESLNRLCNEAGISPIKLSSIVERIKKNYVEKSYEKKNKDKELYVGRYFKVTDDKSYINSDYFCKVINVCSDTYDKNYVSGLIIPDDVKYFANESNPYRIWYDYDGITIKDVHVELLTNEISEEEFAKAMHDYVDKLLIEDWTKNIT